MTDRTVQFAGCEQSFAPLGVGTWAWGDKSTWGMGGYDTELSEATIREAFEASVAAGVRLFDTAEVYGSGASESILGRCLADFGDDVVVATKFWPAPWKLRVRRQMRAALEASLERLGRDNVELYQIHGPISLRSAQALGDGLADLVDAGLVASVGVSNYSLSETERMHAVLAERGVALASNQVEVSLLRTRPFTSGLVDGCAALGVQVLAYSPLGQGRLTGKYSAVNPPPGGRTFSNYPMKDLARLLARLRTIGEHHDTTSSQVALRWLIQKGTVPIPGAKSAKQANQNAGALGWSLDDEEMAQLDAGALPGLRSLRHRVWQHG